MNKAVKYIAMGFAIFLAVVIIGSIITAALGVLGVFSFIGGGVSISSDSRLVEFSETYQNIDSLEVSFGAGQLKIVEGTEFRVEGYNLPSGFSSEKDGGKLKVKAERYNIANIGGNSPVLTVTVPKETLDKLELKIGAGELNCTGINAGSGKISGGAGKMVIKNCTLNDFDIDTGVGEMIFTGDLTGDSKVNCGIGRVELNILRDRTDYTLKVRTGIGAVHIDGESVSSFSEKDKGENYLDVSGGIGAVDISFR